MIEFIYQFPVLCTFILGLILAYTGAAITNIDKYAKYWKYTDYLTVVGVVLMLFAGILSIYR